MSLATFFADFSEKNSEIKPHLSGSFYKKRSSLFPVSFKKNGAELLKACLYRHFVNEQEI